MDILQNREVFSIKRFLLIFSLVLILIINSFVSGYITARAFILETATLLTVAKALAFIGLTYGLTKGTFETVQYLNSDEFKFRADLALQILDGKINEVQRFALDFIVDPTIEYIDGLSESAISLLDTVKATGKITWDFFKEFNLLEFISTLFNSTIDPSVFMDEVGAFSNYGDLLPEYNVNSSYKSIYYPITVNNDLVNIPAYNGGYTNFHLRDKDTIVKMFTDNYTYDDVKITTFPAVRDEYNNEGLSQYYYIRYNPNVDGSFIELVFRLPISLQYTGLNSKPEWDKNITYEGFYMFSYNVSNYPSPSLSIREYDPSGNYTTYTSNSAGHPFSSNSINIASFYSKFVELWSSVYSEPFPFYSLSSFKSIYAENLVKIEGVSGDYYPIQAGLVYENVSPSELATSIPFGDISFDTNLKEISMPIFDLATISQVGVEQDEAYYNNLILGLDEMGKIKLDVDERTGYIVLDEVMPDVEVLEEVKTGTITDPVGETITKSGLLELLKEAIIPRENYFQDFFTSISLAFQAKIPVLGTLEDFFNNLLGLNFDEFGPPVFEITLLEKWGGGTYNILDFRFFTEYRSFVLNLIRFPAWFFFLKRLYSRMANIIY